MPSTASSAAALARSSWANRSHRKTGSIASRTTVMTFGTVRIRSVRTSSAAVSVTGSPYDARSMPTLFTKIIEGDIPGRFVWRQEDVVAFLTINPIMPGHTLVVPVAEVDHWVDLEPTVAARCFEVAQIIGRAQMEAFSPTRIG